MRWFWERMIKYVKVSPFSAKVLLKKGSIKLRVQEGALTNRQPRHQEELEVSLAVRWFLQRVGWVCHLLGLQVSIGIILSWWFGGLSTMAFCYVFFGFFCVVVWHT